MNNVLLSSKTDDWATPTDIYNLFIKNGYFDPCPLHSTFDGLNISWSERTYINPPYSKISSFVDKFINEYKENSNFVMLIPSRTDTKYFSKLFDFGCDFYFVRGRLKFGGSNNSAPFPSVFVVKNNYTYNNMYIVEREDLKAILFLSVI